MKTLFAIVGFVTMWAVPMFNGVTAETSKLDKDGYIRDWIMLAPIPLPERAQAEDLLLREQIKNEARLQPKQGDSLTIGKQKLSWKNITASTNYFDFNEILNSQNDHTAGFMVTYLECNEEIKDVIMAVASNDQGRIYFNGVDIYAFTEPRPLMLDQDKGRVTLKKGVNVIVFKIINVQNSWQGAMRLMDKAGKPLKDLKVRRSP